MKWVFKIMFKAMEWLLIISGTVVAIPFIVVFSIPYSIIKTCIEAKSK